MTRLAARLTSQVLNNIGSYHGENKINTHTVVGNYMNTKKTMFDFNFSFYQAIKQHGYWMVHNTHKEKLSIKILLVGYL